MPPQEPLVWTVITHVHREHSVDWYWTVGLIVLVAAGISIWLGNILLAIILIVGVGSLGALMMRGPREHTVRVDGRGVTIDGTLHAYKTIQSFWVDTHYDTPRLYLTLENLITPHITLPIDSEAHGGQLRSVLKRFVKEEEQQPHFGEHLAQMLGL